MEMVIRFLLSFRKRSPSRHQLRTVLQRLRQMHRLDLTTSCQVRNRVRKFEYAMVTARGQIRLTHRGADETLTCFI